MPRPIQVLQPPPLARPAPLGAKMVELGMAFTADAIEHSQVTETNGELLFVTPADFRLAMNEKDIQRGRSSSSRTGR